MHTYELNSLKHKHHFHIDSEKQGERRTHIVILLTVIMMAMEIVGGSIFGSMALLADALTSILAIIALITGKFFEWVWMDPIMGIVGALIIARWSYGLLCDTARVLLDGEADTDITTSIRNTLESDADNRVSDLHLWRVGPYHFAAIITVLTHNPKSPGYYKSLLSRYRELCHVTIEVHGFPGPSCLSSTNKGAG